MAFEGTLKQLERKTSKKGTTYHRVLVERDGSGNEWHTYFGTVDDSMIGARCAFAQKPLGDGMCIDTITVLEAAAVPEATGQGGVQGATPKGGGHRDMWIFAECMYQHAINKYNFIEGQDFLGTCRVLVTEAIKHAIIANETFKAYDADGVVAARKILRAAADGDSGPVAQAEELADRAAQADSDANAGDYDDDIPF
jgi:hypothetical protein